MNQETVTARAHPNIALIKYWGNRDDALRLPANGSISFNLEALVTVTSVFWVSAPEQKRDSLSLNGNPIFGSALKRLSAFLDVIRSMTGSQWRAVVVSENNFPSGAGIASSAAAFAALALAASRAAGLELSEAELSRLARRGSGSASRSIPGGFTEWFAGNSDPESYALSIAPPEWWDLSDCVAIISTVHKGVGSSEGHALAGTSPLQASRVADTPRRLNLCRSAIQQRDFTALAEITEYDSRLMHTVMMTSTPALFYRQEATLNVIAAIRAARALGLPACTTVDAGANVHVICESPVVAEVERILKAIAGVQEVRRSSVGGPASLQF